MRSIFYVPSTSIVNASTRLPLRSMPEDARALTISTSLTFEVDIAVAVRKPKKQCLRLGDDQTSPRAGVMSATHKQKDQRRDEHHDWTSNKRGSACYWHPPLHGLGIALLVHDGAQLMALLFFIGFCSLLFGLVVFIMVATSFNLIFAIPAALSAA